MDFLDNPFIYVEYTVAVILFTQLLKAKTCLHAKWTSLIVGLVFAAVGIVLKVIVLHEGMGVWKLITSYSVANVFYDYILKVITDRFNLPNGESKPKV